MNQPAQGDARSPHETSGSGGGGPPEGPVLVTGGAGFVGSHVAERLLRERHRVVLLDAVNAETSTPDEKRDNLNLLRTVADATPGASLAVYELDILDEPRVTEMLRAERPAACIHSAAHVMDRSSVDSPREFIDNNCLGTCLLLEAVRNSGTIKHLVYVSSRSAMGEKNAAEARAPMTEQHPLQPINIYGATKAAAEHICYVYHRLYGLSVNACRLFPVFGPRGRVDMFPRRLLEKLADGRTIEIYGDTSSMRDWLYIADAVDGLVRALRTPMGYEIFNMGSGTATTLSDLIAIAEEVVGKKAALDYVPAVPGDARFVGVCDHGKAKRLLGWEPRTELRAGLEKTFAHLRRASKDGAAG